jgi:hypothetical protein
MAAKQEAIMNHAVGEGKAAVHPTLTDWSTQVDAARGRCGDALRQLAAPW